MQAGVAVHWGLWFALSMSQAAPTPPAATTGRIAGRVTAEGANTPIAGARIMLMPSTRPMRPMGMPPRALTDQDGRFVFDQLAPGSYRLDVQKTGFAPLVEPGRAQTAQVSAGQTTELALHLQKGAVIAGKLLDASGEPVTDVRIMAMHRQPSGRAGAAAMRLIPAPGGGQTNDLGEFRIAGLAPGEYYVAAMPRAGSPFGGAAVTPTANGTAHTTTYYAGTIDQATAQTITIAAGETVDNIVFSLQSVPAFRISGRVVDENGAPVAGAMVMLIGADSRANAFMGPTGNARTGDDGRFTISEVPSGTYRLNGSVPMMMRGSGGGVSGGVVGGVRAGSGSFTSWSAGSGVAGGFVGGTEQATEVIVNGANVTGVRVVVRPQTPQ
jgi:protocatechuate 3,4-dioxygenase beta subunit